MPRHAGPLDTKAAAAIWSCFLITMIRDRFCSGKRISLATFYTCSSSIRFLIYIGILIISRREFRVPLVMLVPLAKTFPEMTSIFRRRQQNIFLKSGFSPLLVPKHPPIHDFFLLYSSCPSWNSWIFIWLRLHLRQSPACHGVQPPP